MSIIIYVNHCEMTNKISRKILITTVKNQFFGIFIILCVLRINVDTKDMVYLFLYFVIFLGRTLSSVMLKKFYFTCLILHFHVCFCVYMCVSFLILVSMIFEVGTRSWARRKWFFLWKNECFRV